MQQGIEVPPVALGEFGRVTQVGVDGTGLTRVDLPLVEALQGVFAGTATRRRRPGPYGSRASTRERRRSGAGGAAGPWVADKNVLSRGPRPSPSERAQAKKRDRSSASLPPG